MKNNGRSSWLLLITNLPGQNQTLRMRIWRALKAAGAELLRDGVYVLPHAAASRKIFGEQAAEIQAAAGSAHILTFASESKEHQAVLLAMFDRSNDYREIHARLDVYKRKVATMSELDARRGLAVIARDAAVTAAIDFFPGKSQSQMQGALKDVEAALNARFSPNEPRPTHRKIARRDPKNYRGRTWATREHLWIDRVCCAWLIRRFIDSRAKFVWLKRIDGRPKRAIGFDFDGAEFSHVDSKVTFEVLLTSFGLEGDAGLARLGTLVHFLDVGGIAVAEAPGLEAIVSGARSLQPDDHSLLLSVTPALDSLHRFFQTEKGLTA